jgi:hypothetical protein
MPPGRHDSKHNGTEQQEFLARFTRLTCTVSAMNSIRQKTYSGSMRFEVLKAMHVKGAVFGV